MNERHRITSVRDGYHAAGVQPPTRSLRPGRPRRRQRRLCVLRYQEQHPRHPQAHGGESPHQAADGVGGGFREGDASGASCEGGGDWVGGEWIRPL